MKVSSAFNFRTLRHIKSAITIAAIQLLFATIAYGNPTVNVASRNVTGYPGDTIKISGTYTKTYPACLKYLANFMDPNETISGYVQTGVESLFVQVPVGSYSYASPSFKTITNPCSASTPYELSLVIPMDAVTGTTTTGSFSFTEYGPSGNVKKNAANTVTVTVPSDYPRPPQAIPVYGTATAGVSTTIAIGYLPTSATASGYVITKQALGGTSSISGSTITYTPSPSFSGTDYIEYAAINSYGQGQTAYISIAVAPPGANSSYLKINYNGTADTYKEIEIGSGAQVDFAFTSPWGTQCTAGGLIAYATPILRTGYEVSINGAAFVDVSGNWGGMEGCSYIRSAQHFVAANETAGFFSPILFKVGDSVTVRGYKVAEKCFFNKGCSTSFSGYSQNTLTFKVIPKKPDNSAPVVSDASKYLNEDTPSSLVLTATDPDIDDVQVFSIVTGPSHGSAIISGTSLNYTPPANWSGTTTLTYKTTDAQGVDSNIATITLTVSPVNDSPLSYPATLNTSEDTPGSAALSGSDVDIPYGDSLSYEVVAQPGQGSASISGSTVNYTPPANWSGTTSMTYRAKDLAGAFSPAVTITINVAAVNDLPVAAAKSIITNEDTAGSVTMSATDIDSPAPTVFQVVSAPANGSAAISGSTLTFTPTGNWSGSTSLTYRAQDSAGAWSAPVTVTITVNPVNDAPTAVAKSIITNEDSAGSVSLSVVDPDIAYGDSHTFELVGLSANGTEVISGSTLTFTPAADWNGSTSVTYRAKDEAGVYSAAVTVSITVNPVNDAPVSQAKTGSTDEDTPTTLTLTATDIDSPVPAVFQIVAAPNASYGTASITGATLTFTPVANWHGTASMTYRAQDSSGAWSAPVTVTITVISVNDVPAVTASKLSLKTKESKAVTTKYLVSP